MPNEPLNVLLVEDNPADAELMTRELRRAGFDLRPQRVETEAEYLEKLSNRIDIILSDYQLPTFTGARALQLLKERDLDIPFIIVSGTIGEETAVAAMRDGADDYLLKDRIARLGQAVERALRQKQLRDERKRAEERLNNLMRQHQLILNSTAEGIHGITLEGKITFENPKAAELLGWTRSEMIGRAAHETIHHSHADGSPYPVESCPIYESMRDGKTRRVTNDVFWRKDGSCFRADYVSAPVRDNDGKIVGCIVTFKDNTEQYVAEQRLKLQEQQYRLLFETNPNSMWVFDPRTLQILAVNQAAIAQYGYSREEFLQRKLTDLRLPEEQPHLLKAIKAPTAPAQFTGEFRHVTKEGALINVLIYSSPLIWERVAARMVTAIDVTERKKAEERLREQAEIIDRAQDAIIMRNYDDLRIVFWNKGAERLYGWTAAERIGLSDVTTLAERSDVDLVMESLRATDEFSGELKQLTKSGKELVADVRGTLVRDAAGVPRSILLICTDITEKKNLEIHLLRAQRLESIGTLASGVAHDLNNILTPILMGAETLDDHGDPEARGVIDLILASARRGANIVKQVLTFARGIEGERVAVNPRHLIEEMADIARNTFPKSIEVTAKWEDEIWSIRGDPTQLHQVLLNLSVNARDAMPDGGSLELAAANVQVDEGLAATIPGGAVGPHLLLRVTDTGTGMSPETIEKIFDPFFTTKESGKGTGLGLSTTMGIVKSHGGFIAVTSQPGSGTTFRIFLPAIDSDANAAAIDSAELKAGHNELILVVDDEELIRQVTKVALEENGYCVLEAKDGPEAVTVFARHADAIRAVVSDIMLPFMDGAEVIRSMKEIRPNVLIIAASGDDDQQVLARLKGLGIAAFLPKPYGIAQLLSTVSEVCSRASGASAANR
jgi:two-component system cell cycle sensor histidine kinase/response regulator CckA